MYIERVVASVELTFQASIMRWEVLLAFCSVMVGSQANVEVMKDVTLGFGEALQNCREEVRTKSYYK